MPVNHASTLTKEYFISYLTLIMKSRGFSLDQAKSFAIEFFFRSDSELYGSSTWSQFEMAFKEIDEKCSGNYA